MSNFKLSKRSRRNMQGLHPIMAFFVEMLIKETKQDFGILDKGGVRSDFDQLTMYKQGRSTEGKKITWTYDSYHQYGLAVDTVAFNNGKFNWKTKNYKEITRAGKAIIEKYDLPIEHGFDLWGKDLPHWQMTGYKTRYDIRNIMV